jgi:hypothetical protein
MNRVSRNSLLSLGRSKRMHLKKIIIVFILLLGLLQIPGLAQEKRFNVKGEISFPKKGAIMISLLTKEEFESNKDPQFAMLGKERTMHKI